MDNNKKLKLLNQKEVARLLGNIKTTDVILKIKTGELPGYKLSKKVFGVKETDLEEYIDTKKVQVRTI